MLSKDSTTEIYFDVFNSFSDKILVTLFMVEEPLAVEIKFGVKFKEFNKVEAASAAFLR